MAKDQRFVGRGKVINRLEMYREQIEARNVRAITHYASPTMIYPSVEQLQHVRQVKHVWKLGDRFYKLAEKYYKRKHYWWIIAWFNQTPTENHLVTGQLVRIPVPLDTVISYLRYE